MARAVRLTGKVKRVRKSRVHIRLLREKCTGCRKCVQICPSGSWTVEKGEVGWKGMSRCLECGACFHVCPSNAIIWRYPEGGEGVVYRF